MTGPQDAMRRELRVHRLLLVATLALLALLVLTGAAVPSMEELRARRIALLDAEGAPTAVLEGCPGGARLVPPAGGAGRAIELSLSGEGPALGLRDDTGTLRLLATIQRRGSGFAVLDSTGKLRAELRTADAGAEFYLRDAGGKARVGAGAVGDAAGVQVFDAAHPRLTLEVGKGLSRILLTDPDQAPRVLLQAGRRGENGLQLRDGGGRPIWEQLEQTPPGPAR